MALGRVRIRQRVRRLHRRSGRGHHQPPPAAARRLAPIRQPHQLPRSAPLHPRSPALRSGNHRGRARFQTSVAARNVPRLFRSAASFPVDCHRFPIRPTGFYLILNLF